LIHRFPRDGVGFYGLLPFWTHIPGGKVAPSMPAATPGTRTPWGKYVSWNGVMQNGKSAWSQWDILFNKNNYLAYNDVSSVNRQGLDGGVIESWGSSINNTWERNAIHDNEGYAGLSLMFADDFTPSLLIQQNVIYNNDCPILSGNCATFMMKSVNMTTQDNIVADQNYTHVYEFCPYRMPAANMVVQRNILYETVKRPNDAAKDRAVAAYSASCLSIAPWEGHLSPQNATLGDLLGNGDGTSAQRTMRAQYGFTAGSHR
jgi:hypothetical protein